MAADENSIQHFKSTFLKNGVARPTRYRVSLTGPEETLTFQPETVTLPGRAFVLTTDDLFFGPERKMPIARDFTGQVILQFAVADNQGERTFFEAWMDEIVNPGTNMMEYRSQGNTVRRYNMKIETLNSAGDMSSTYEFEETYPVQIMPSNLGYGEMNTYMTIQVAMEFRSYKYRDGDMFETQTQW